MADAAGPRPERASNSSAETLASTRKRNRMGAWPASAGQAIARVVNPLSFRPEQRWLPPLIARAAQSMSRPTEGTLHRYPRAATPRRLERVGCRLANAMNADLLEHLREQMYFLKASAGAFDAGVEIEAKRLAVVVRTLVHDGASTSLLNLIGTKAEMVWFDSTRRSRGAVGRTLGGGMIVHSATAGVPGSATIRAPLDGLEPDVAAQRTSFAQWWGHDAIPAWTPHPGFS